MSRRRNKNLLFEHKSEPLLPRRRFYFRVLKSSGVAAVLLFCFLGLGVLGYHAFAGLPWLDALLNASMIMSGMGPVDELKSAGAKWFASIYAIASGVMFITTVGLLLGPPMHRLMHRFHMELEEEDEKKERAADQGQSKNRNARKAMK